MAWALQRAAREKQAEEQEEEQEEECEAALNAKLAARGVDLSLRAPPPRAYANIRQDIAGLGGGATFGDVMNLLRQGPQGRQHTEMRQQARRGGGESAAATTTAAAAAAAAPQNKREHALAARSMLDGIKAMQTMLAAGEDPTRTALAMRSQLSTLMGGGSSSSLPSVRSNGSPSNGSPSNANARRRAPPHLPSRHRGNAARFPTNRSGGTTSEENMPPIEGNGHANAAAAFRLRQVAAGKKPSSSDNGSFGVPQGADIRTKGSTEHWTARKRTRDEWTEEEKKADEEKQERKEKEAAAALAQNSGGGTKGILDLIQVVDDKIDGKLNKRETAVADLSTSVNVCVVQSTRHRSHVFVGLGCGDVRVIDLGPNTTLPSDLPEESATLAPPLLLAGHKGYVGALVAVGQLCFSGSFDGSIRGWKYSAEKVVVQSTAHRAPVHGLCYSASNRKVYSCSSDGTVRVWDLAAGKSQSLSEHFSCPCFSITLSEKRNALFVGLEDGSIAVVDARSGAVIRDLKGHSGMVSALHFSPKANVLASASVDGTCRVWFAGQCIVEYTEHECPLYAIALLQGGTYAVSGGSDGTIHRWNCSTGKTTTVYRSGIADTIFSLVPHRGRLLSSGRDGVVRFWKASSPCEFCEERCDCAMVGYGAASAGRSGGGSSSSSSNSSSSSRTGGGDYANISGACMYQIVSCPNAGCSLKCARCDLQRHAGDCAYREMRCPNPGCKETMPHAEIKAHNDRDCPYAKVKCPNAAVNGGWGCVAALRRRHLAEHMLLCHPPEEEQEVAEAPPPSPRSSAAGGAMAAIKQQKGSGKKRTKILARKKKKGIGSTGQGNRTKIALRNSRSYKEQLRRKRREEEENRRRRDAEEEEEEE